MTDMFEDELIVPKMFDDIDLFKADVIIPCKDLKDPSDIYEIMKKINARDYAYTVSYNTGAIVNPVVKIGMSSPRKDRKNNVMGERLVRQLAHLEGWNSKTFSANGSDLAMNLRVAIDQGIIPKKAINRNNIIICIWNLAFRMCTSEATTYEQTSWIEGELCRLHKKHFEFLPPLNIVDPSEAENFKKGRIPSNIVRPVTGLFTFE